MDYKNVRIEHIEPSKDQHGLGEFVFWALRDDYSRFAFFPAHVDARFVLNVVLEALEHSRPKEEGEIRCEWCRRRADDHSSVEWEEHQAEAKDEGATTVCYPSAHKFPAWFMDPQMFMGGSVTCVCGLWTLPVNYVIELVRLPDQPPTETCHADRDGDCSWAQCPQLLDYKVSCPLIVHLPDADEQVSAFLDAEPAPTETRFTRKYMGNKWEIFKAGNTISTCHSYGEKDSLLVLEALNAYDRTLKGEAR